jgi:uncharacterized protein (DUF736 family)
MSKQYDDTNRGALFKNDKKESESHPDYKGNLNVGGKDFWISSWIKKDRNGNTFMSLSVKPKDGRPERETPAARPRQEPRDTDDSEIPF